MEDAERHLEPLDTEDLELRDTEALEYTEALELADIGILESIDLELLDQEELELRDTEALEYKEALELVDTGILKDLTKLHTRVTSLCQISETTLRWHVQRCLEMQGNGQGAMEDSST